MSTPGGEVEIDVAALRGAAERLRREHDEVVGRSLVVLKEDDTAPLGYYILRPHPGW